jgi:hypothetical protein
VKDVLGLPVDSSKLELDIMLNNAKQKRLEQHLQDVLHKQK